MRIENDVGLIYGFMNGCDESILLTRIPGAQI